jgi:thiol-disulfide isomerase/thioredoxin
MNRKTAVATIASAILGTGFATRRAFAASSGEREWLPILSSAPWVGVRPAPSALRGRVVLVDVFTFECVNCTRVVPNLKALRAGYSRSDLAIVGVHAPEVPSYQANFAYVAKNVRAQAFAWPVVLDDELHLWNRYGIDAWPTQLLFDRRGIVRHRIVGDSQDAALDGLVEELVRERALS